MRALQRFARAGTGMRWPKCSASSRERLLSRWWPGVMIFGLSVWGGARSCRLPSYANHRYPVEVISHCVWLREPAVLQPTAARTPPRRSRPPAAGPASRTWNLRRERRTAVHSGTSPRDRHDHASAAPLPRKPPSPDASPAPGPQPVALPTGLEIQPQIFVLVVGTEPGRHAAILTHDLDQRDRGPRSRRRLGRRGVPPRPRRRPEGRCRAVRQGHRRRPDGRHHRLLLAPRRLTTLAHRHNPSEPDDLFRAVATSTTNREAARLVADALEATGAEALTLTKPTGYSDQAAAHGRAPRQPPISAQRGHQGVPPRHAPPLPDPQHHPPRRSHPRRRARSLPAHRRPTPRFGWRHAPGSPVRRSRGCRAWRRPAGGG